MTSTANEDPLRAANAYGESSVFQPENLLREARRQKRLPDVGVPTVCLLDPDRDVLRYLTTTGDDFEKVHANGAVAALAMTAAIARTLRPVRPHREHPGRHAVS